LQTALVCENTKIFEWEERVKGRGGGTVEAAVDSGFEVKVQEQRDQRTIKLSLKRKSVRERRGARMA
jgi:hypothetical protein